MGFWSFIGGFALFNAVCDMFSSKPKATYVPTQQHFHSSGCKNRHVLGADFNDVDALQYSIDDLEDRIDDIDVMSERYDALQDRIDYLEELEYLKEELDDLRDELDDLEFDLYDE